MNKESPKPSPLRANWINVILGIWVAISPFILNFVEIRAALWNSIAAGLIVMIHELSRRTGYRIGCNLNVVFGFWLVASPFALGVWEQRPYWNSIIVGFVICFTALLADT